MQLRHRFHQTLYFLCISSLYVFLLLVCYCFQRFLFLFFFSFIVTVCVSHTALKVYLTLLDLKLGERLI